MNDGVVYLISYLVTPIVLGIAGLVSWRFPPKYGENVGYRTQRSKSSEAAWDFAQVFWGRLILIISIPVLAVSAAVGVFQTANDVGEDAGLVICCIVIALQLTGLFVSIGCTESALKKWFGK